MPVKHTFWNGKESTITKDLYPIKAIRQKCLECSAGSPNEVAICPIQTCALYPFRFGKDPSRKKVVLSDEQKAIRRQRILDARKPLESTATVN
jgi:hypothetical protein